MKWRHVAVTCAALALLAGCTTPAPRPPAPPPVVHTPQPAPTASVKAPAAAPVVKPTPGLWSRLRTSFAMPDCIRPAVRRARRETRNRHGFEQHLHDILPLIAYIEHAAANAGVAGEFVLLPWVESHFRGASHGRHGSAGMWQIMPVTARALGLPSGRRYDGRLDKIASTRAVMGLLARYYRQWDDWRVVDMAYNTGATRMRHVLKARGMPPAKPVVPDLPVGQTTRHHLVKLLAIACIIRDPGRFHVRLPAWNPDRRLEVVKLPGPARLRQLAQLSGMPLSRLRKLNAGYRLDVVTRGTPMQLLLPNRAARQLRRAITAGQLHAPDADAPVAYTVAAGDSLWSIAHRFHLQVSQLRRWNQLHGSVLQPGQVLLLEPPATR